MKKILAAVSLVALTAIIWLLMPKPITQENISASPQPQQTDTVTLRLGHDSAKGTPIDEAARQFAREIEKKSGGELKITVYPAQGLGNAYEMLEMARNGTLDLLLIPSSKMSIAAPSMQYTDLPFLFPDPEDAHALLDGAVGEMLLDRLRSIGLVGITFWEAGFKHFTADKPLLSPEDFNGTKFRIMKSRIIMEQFKSLHAEPIPIDFFKTKQALKEGVVGGQENPLIAVVAMGFNEVQSDLTLSAHAYLNYVLSLSAKTFDKLTPDQRGLLIKEARAITPVERHSSQEKEQALLDILKKSGMHIHTLSEAQRQALADQTSHITKQYEEEIGTDIISKTEESLYLRHRPANEERPIVIGIDADLSMGGKNAGLAIKQGVELAVNDINAKGGLLGKKVIVIAKDHQGNASKGAENIEKMIAIPEVAGVIGGKHSAVIANEIEDLKEAKLPYIIPWAAASSIVENNVSSPLFRVSINDADASKYLAGYALAHYKNPAVIVENSIWGRGTLEKIRHYLQQTGIKTPIETTINRGQKQFTGIIQKIKTGKADAIILVLNELEGSNFVQSLAKNDLRLPVISHWGITGKTFFEANKENLKKLDVKFLQSFLFTTAQRPQAKQLQQAYFDLYGNGTAIPIPLPSGVAQGYDATRLLILAIQKAGTTDRTKVRDALEQLPPYEGVLKRYDPPFSKERHEALDEQDLFIAVYDENGSIKPIRQ